MSNMSDLDIEIRSELRSKVYNALSNVSFEIFEKYKDLLDTKTEQQYMDYAYEWFTTHFYDENNADNDN